MSDDEEHGDRTKTRNIRELLASIKQAASVQNEENNTHASKSDIEELLAYLRRGNQELIGRRVNTVVTKRNRVTACSFCDRSLSESDNYVSGDAGVAICVSCLKECARVLEEDDPETS